MLEMSRQSPGDWIIVFQDALPQRVWHGNKLCAHSNLFPRDLRQFSLISWTLGSAFAPQSVHIHECTCCRVYMLQLRLSFWIVNHFHCCCTYSRNFDRSPFCVWHALLANPSWAETCFGKSKIYLLPIKQIIIHQQFSVMMILNSLVTPPMRFLCCNCLINTSDTTVFSWALQIY